jgi:hypothetical protein
MIGHQDQESYSLLSIVQWFFLGIVAIMLLFPIILMLFVGPHDVLTFFLEVAPDSFYQFAFLAVPCLIAFGVLRLYTVPHLKTRIQLYRRALSGAIVVPLALPQPVSFMTSSALPIKMRMKLNWLRLALLCAYALAISGPFIFHSLFGTRNAVVDDLLGWSDLVLVLGLPLALASRPRFNVSPRMIVTSTDEYLLVTRSNLNYTVQWSEARLFSVIGQREERPMVLRYALEGNGVTAEWWMYTRPPRWFDVARLGMPYEEYDRRMREILSVVSAKTGLPLLELR